MATTRKQLADDERIAQAQARADAVKARIAAKRERQELATLARSLPTLIRRAQWDTVYDLACSISGAAMHHVPPSRTAVSK